MEKYQLFMQPPLVDNSAFKRFGKIKPGFWGKTVGGWVDSLAGFWGKTVGGWVDSLAGFWGKTTAGAWAP